MNSKTSAMEPGKAGPGVQSVQRPVVEQKVLNGAFSVPVWLLASLKQPCELVQELQLAVLVGGGVGWAVNLS